MKNIISLLLSFAMALSLAACSNNRHTQIDVPVYTLPDLSYWQENIRDADAAIYIGNAASFGAVTGDRVLDLIKNIEFGRQESVYPQDANFTASHRVSLENKQAGKSINAVFYNDFGYVAIYNDSENFQSVPLYRLTNSEQCRQFFTDNNYYMPLAVRCEIVGKLSDIITSGNVQQLNRKAQPSPKDGSIVDIVPKGQLKRLEISNVYPLSYNYSDYWAYIEIFYDCGAEQQMYYGNVGLDKNLDIMTVSLNESSFENEITGQYTIADIDYTIWMQRLDAPQYNNFRYWLGAGSSAHREDSMQWTTAIMSCVKNLSLGEMVDINIKDYPRNQTYRIVLEEGSSYYSENTLVFEFYDDCNYLIVCNHNSEGDTAVSVCENHTKAYRVNNPETVRQIFSIQGQYVSPQDYESLQKIAQKTMEDTSSEKLNKIIAGDKKIAENFSFKGDIAHFKAENIDHTHMDNGREDYRLQFTAMFTKPETDSHDKYISYQIRMHVFRKGSSWQVESIYIL